MKRLLLASLVLIATALGAGCANVNAWQRGHLARPDMQLAGDPLAKALNKTYAAKEAGTGSAGVGEGGCGCN